MKSSSRLKILTFLTLTLAGLSAGGCRRPAATTPLIAVETIPWENNLLLGQNIGLTASSYNLNSEQVEKLLDNDPHTFWHVDGKSIGLPAWVKVDFGEGRGAAVSTLAFRPRVGREGRVFGDQFFWNAKVQASRDGIDWRSLAWLRMARPPDVSSWYRADLDNREEFRFWRILIMDGHSGKSKNFLSMADLAFFD